MAATTAWSSRGVNDADTPRAAVGPGLVLHLVPAADWAADADRPYAPDSLAEEGFVHCSPDEATTLAVATAFYADAPRPLLALHLDPSLLAADVVLEAPSPVPPPGVAEDVLFPHVLGPLDRGAVVRVQEVVFDGGEALRLRDHTPTLTGDGTVRGCEGRGE